MTTLIWLAATSIVWGAVLCLAALMLQRHGDLSGHARQWVWRAATLLLIAPWVATPIVSVLGLGLASPASQPVIVQAAAPVLAPSPQVEPALAAIDVATVSSVSVVREASSWLPASIAWTELVLAAIMIGWVARFVLAQLSARSLMGMVVNSRPARGGAALQALKTWAARLSLKRLPRLRFGAANVSPFSCGVLRPVICLPDGLERKLNRDALDLVVGHECLHIARGDGWWRPLERIAADVLWFNPFAWVIRRELDMARELACDESVVRLSAAPRVYARTLRDVAGFAAGLPPTLPAASMSLAGSGRALVVRVQRALVGAPRGVTRGAVVGGLVFALVGGGVAVGQAMLVTPERVHMVYAPMEMRVVEVVRVQGAARVRLASVEQGENAACEITLGAMHDVAVAQGDVVREGAPIGRRAQRAVRVSACELDDVALARVAVMPAPVPPIPLPVPSSQRAGALGPAASAIVPLPRVAPVPAPQTPVAPQAPARGLPPMKSAIVPVLKGRADRLSGFGNRVDHFNNGKSAFHNGTDFGQERGSTIYAPADGTVTFAGVKGSYGRVVEIAMTDDYAMSFGHLNSITVNVGDRVKAGDKVGSMGSTGRSTGPHLHVEVRHKGALYDPETIPGLRLADTIVEGPPALMAPVAPLAPPAPVTPPTPAIAPNPASVPSPVTAPRPASRVAPVAPVSPVSPPDAVAPPAPALSPAPPLPPPAGLAPAPPSPPAGALSPAPLKPLSPAPYRPAGRLSPTPYAPTAALSPNLGVGGMPATAAEAEFWRQQHRARIEPNGAEIVKARQQMERSPILFVLSDSKPVINRVARLSSGYGYRIDPSSGREALHSGVDIAAPIGTAVHSPALGKVTRADENDTYGRFVEVTLECGAVMRFASLSAVSAKIGDTVAAGDEIGAIGMTGGSTGPHLHFEVIHDGKAINPASVGNLVMIGG